MKRITWMTPFPIVLLVLSMGWFTATTAQAQKTNDGKSDTRTQYDEVRHYVLLQNREVVAYFLQVHADGKDLAEIEDFSKITQLTLRGGTVVSGDFGKWGEKVGEEGAKKKDLTVQLENGDGAGPFKVNLYQTWPTTWTTPIDDNASDDIATEEVVLVFEEMEMG